MCKSCVDYARKLWPDKGPQEINDILWEWTAYPVAGANFVQAQLDEIKAEEKTNEQA